MIDQAPLSIEEACTAAGRSRSTIFNAIRAGDLRVIKAGRRTLIRLNDLKRWLSPSAAPAWQSSAIRRLSSLKCPIVEMTKAEMQRELAIAAANTAALQRSDIDQS